MGDSDLFVTSWLDGLGSAAKVLLKCHLTSWEQTLKLLNSQVDSNAKFF